MGLTRRRPLALQGLDRRALALLMGLAFSSTGQALSIDEARHLLTRSGFGAAPHEIARLLPMSREQAVDTLLAEIDTTELVPPPAFVDQRDSNHLDRMGPYAPPEMTGGRVPAVLTEEQDRQLTHQGIQEIAQLRIWWLDQMISTRSPLTERIALFWHNHFTSKYLDVLAPQLMYDQLRLIRHGGTRNFASLLDAMTRDPAMLVFLDNALNTRKAPNENFARELLELFTLGIGHYSQQDITELARMLAGHSVDFAGQWTYLLRPDELDTGVKTFLGHRGNLNAQDGLRILLAEPRTAQFLTQKFYREFVSPTLDAAEVERLAAVLRGQGYEMQPFLRALFLSDGFWSPANRGQLVKSPVELLVGFARSVGVWLPDGETLAAYATQLGQDLFEPPTVEGWKGGMHWLTLESIAKRRAMIDKLWAARSANQDLLRAGSDDLIVRYSAETTQGVPARFALRVNGRTVYQGRAQWPSDPVREGLSRPKPMWETARVPRHALPRDIRTVEVVFGKPKDAPPVLFVNWIQVDGKRLPSRLATVAFSPRERCRPDGGDIPIGMLYCSAHLRFDVAGLPAYDPRQATLDDREHGWINSIIENGTARVQMAMKPAARSQETLRQRAADELRSVLPPGGRPELMVSAVSAVAPMLPRQPGAGHDEGLLRSITLDPAYNLK